MNNKLIKSKKTIFSLLILGVLFASAFIVKCSTTKPDDAMQPYFVAVSRANSVAYSKDGSKWEFVEDAVKGISAEFHSICYGKDENDNNIFVAVGSGICYYSTDGVNWEEGKGSVLSGNNWQSVCYGNGTYVAVDSSNQKVMSSHNGKNWALVSVLVSVTNGWGAICSGADKFVMIEIGGAADRKVAYSNHNGSSWREVAYKLPGYIGIPEDKSMDWKSICYGNGKFIAVASARNYSGTQRIAYSADGKDWAAAVISTLPNSNWNSVCYGEDKFVAVGGIDGDGTIAYTFNGDEWTEVNMNPKPNEWLTCICYGNKKFVAISMNGIVNYSSNNGVTWSPSNKNLTPSSAPWSSVCFGYVDAEELKRRLF